MICQICNEIYEDNKSGIGKFYMHLKKAHNITKKDYVIKYEYSGKAPMCLCGCGEEPHWSNRRGYSRYAKGHDKFKYREEQYIKEHGKPVCSDPNCSQPVTFYRSIPRKYCSKQCFGNNNGWSLNENQILAKKTLQEKYGVSNSFQIPEVADKIANENIGRKRKMISEEHRHKLSKASKRSWKKNREYMSLCILEGIQSSEKHSYVSSEKMKANMQNEEYLENLWSRHNNRLSKIHQKVRDEYNLQAKGFISEQRIGKYFVDELNPITKEVIEVNGDYVHANPNIYSADDIIRLRGNSYKASYKWRKDHEKIDWLESQGYTVTVVWESDMK